MGGGGMLIYRARGRPNGVRRLDPRFRGNDGLGDGMSGEMTGMSGQNFGMYGRQNLPPNPRHLAQERRHLRLVDARHFGEFAHVTAGFFSRVERRAH